VGRDGPGVKGEEFDLLVDEDQSILQSTRSWACVWIIRNFLYRLKVLFQNKGVSPRQ